MTKQLFIVKGMNGREKALMLPADKHGGLTNKGIELARAEVKSDLDYYANVLSMCVMYGVSEGLKRITKRHSL